MSSVREQFISKLIDYGNVPYIWGYKDPNMGLDCSGLIYNIFKNILQIDPTTVMSAQQYYDYFVNIGSVNVLPGCTNLGDLVFFGKINQIHHVGMALGYNNMMIEAAHGDRSCVNLMQAHLLNAKVMRNPIDRLPDLFAILRVKKITDILG